jgi:phospholipid/cholesterol/gamma-HCH transport system substrate-binding protein
MRAVLRDNFIEALAGLLVVGLAVWFVIFAWQRTGGEIRDTIQVTALFPAANGVSKGTDVRIAGLKVGSVAAQRLDPQSYQAELTLALDKDVRVPSDSSAAITTEGLLGGAYIALLPGGSTTPLKSGDVIMDTQGSVDMMGLVGSLINRSGGGQGAPPPPAAGDEGLGATEESTAR